MEALFVDGLIYLCAAVIAVPVAKRFGLGSVLGYLIAGVLVGPAFGLVNTGPETLRGFAELGVVMMLFLIGLELRPQALWAMRSSLLGLGGLQVGVTIVAVAAVAYYGMGAAWHYSLACGLILSLSSTAIVLQTLTEKGLLKSDGGKASFSVLLFQDIAVIPMLALLPLLAVPELLAFADLSFAAGGGAFDFNIVEGRPGWQVALLNLAAISTVAFGGHFLSRPLFRHIAAARLREIFTAAVLLLVLSTTLLMSLVGLSPALGSFLAGVVLANSEFRHELESNIEPFKGILLGLFFITVGAGIDFEVVANNAGFLAVSAIGLILLKAIILFVIATAFGIKEPSEKWLFTLGLAQAGEFGFVLTAFATQQYVLPAAWGDNILVVVAFSMLLTPVMFMFYERMLLPRLKKETEKEFDTDIKKGTVIIAGHGRFGQVVDRMLLANGFSTVVLEYKADVIDGLRKFGAQTFYGDAARPDLLESAGLKEAKLLVVAIDDVEKSLDIVKYARQERPDLHIIARAWDRLHVFRLYDAGVDDIVREVFDSSVRTGRYALEAMGVEHEDAMRRMNLFINYDTRAVRKLAQLWDPTISVFENEKYITLARRLTDEVNQAMQGDANYAPVNRRMLRNLRGRKPDRTGAAESAKRGPGRPKKVQAK